MFIREVPAYGLDISDLSIKLASLSGQKNNIKLASFGREEIPEKVIENGAVKKEEELIDVLRHTIEQARGEKLKTKNCIVSLPETESYIRVVQLPKIKRDEIAEAIKWELEANIPVSLADVYYDWQEIQIPNASGQLNILIGALPKTLVDPYLSVIKKAGLQPLAFEIESVATARALIKEGELLDPIMLIDMGAKRTSLVIYTGETIWLTTSLPVSNSLLVEDIAKNLKITYAQAKNLKIRCGLDTNSEEGNIYEAMAPRLSEMIAEIKKYLDYFQTANLGKMGGKGTISKILLCGGGANLRGLADFLSAELRLQTEIGNPWINIFGASTKELPEIPYEESLCYTTAIGLALRGLCSV